ncbi:hypothetical protein PISL3812_00507 [Talaromyces islandicus]|uniref:Uncharacterized protein n=1 Tax=Talaromyces islandicus TaxID=28573 RepID=A0A0U1LJH1_TALIS|nr:hypothetical protein PISL3812_00507 [Talaromyces islandicus]
MSSGCRSISPWSPRLRLYSHICRRINQPLSSRFVSPLPIPTRIESSPAVKHYSSQKLRRAPRRRWIEGGNTFDADTPEGKQKIERAQQVLRSDSTAIYKSAVKGNLFDSKVTQSTFEEIARRLIDVSAREHANATTLKKVYDGDPNIVLGVATALNTSIQWHEHVYIWAVFATADAGATIPVVLFVKNELNKPWTSYQTKRFMQLEVLAKRNVPLAMRMQADVYWDQKRYDKAVELLERLHSRTYPSNTRVGYRDDLTVEDRFSPPWRRLIEYYLHLELNDKADAMTKVGALDYQDPDALMAYAHVMKEREDWEVYEQCVSVAATAGNGIACLRLGNFYYLMFQGKIPSADQLPKDASWFHTFFHKMFGTPRTLADFRKLAADWYALALLHGNKKAIRNLVVLLREDGHLEDAYKALSELEISPEHWNSPHIVKLRARIGDPTFRPNIPPSWLEL